MNTKHARLIFLAVFLLASLSFTSLARLTSSTPQISKTNIFAGDPALKDLARYRQWTRVNEKPIEVAAISIVPGEFRLSTDQLALPAVWIAIPADFGPKLTQISTSQGTTRITLSAPPAQLSGKSRRKSDAKTHEAYSSLGVVYVNEIARHALLNETKPEFPAGSVIVREKLLNANAATPEVMVVMVKRERGFNRKAGDWEFLMLDGGLSKVMHREKTGRCRDCHVREKANDYVFRSYMPETARLESKSTGP